MIFKRKHIAMTYT